MKLQLPNVTLCAVDMDPPMAIRALEKSMKYIDFGDVILFTDADHIRPPDAIYGTIRVNHGNSTWPNWYCEFLLRNLHEHIKTPYVLKVEWDGYVINPAMWNSQFLEYDYIGARWPFHKKDRNVGNGGFSLRSKRLLEFTSGLHYRKPVDLDDEFLCREIGDWLTKYHGFKFAPDDIADQFSHERGERPQHTFGFHGFYNFWRYHTDAEIIELMQTLPDYPVRKPEFKELMEKYRELQRNEAFAALDARWSAAQ